MVAGFKQNTKRYVSMFTDIAAELMPKRNKISEPDDVTIDLKMKEIQEKYERILEEHRNENLNSQINEVPDPREKIPISSHQN